MKYPLQNPQKEHIVSSEWIYRGKILNLRIDSIQRNNPKKIVQREFVDHRDATAIIPINNVNKLILIKQYRYATEKNLLEIPAGLIENEEDPLLCAKRELQEETGYLAKKMILLGSFFPSPGFCNELVHFFLARDLEKKPLPPDPEEEITTAAYTKKEIQMIIENGEIQDMKTLLGIFFYFQHI